MHNKILICPASFKGTLTNLQAAQAISSSISSPHTIIPLADGGQGTSNTLLHSSSHWQTRNIHATDPLRRSISATYLVNPPTAFVQISSASGIVLLSKEELNPLKATSFGTGQLINHAMAQGAKEIMLALGGSATMDMGIGMALALGFKFLTVDGTEVNDATLMQHISKVIVPDGIQAIRFTILTDVGVPLLGKNGACWMFGPQKGATLDMIEQLEKAFDTFSRVLEKQFNCQIRDRSGMGAAGGAAAILVAALQSQIKSGVEFVGQVTNLDKQIEEAHLVITGEGRLDQQTLHGKAVSKVIKLASKHSKKVVICCGKNTLCESMPKGVQVLEIGGEMTRESALTSLKETVKKHVS